jgi:hypothetical protein
MLAAMLTLEFSNYNGFHTLHADLQNDQHTKTRVWNSHHQGSEERNKQARYGTKGENP